MISIKALFWLRIFSPTAACFIDPLHHNTESHARIFPTRGHYQHNQTVRFACDIGFHIPAKDGVNSFLKEDYFTCENGHWSGDIPMKCECMYLKFNINAAQM